MRDLIDSQKDGKFYYTGTKTEQNRKKTDQYADSPEERIKKAGESRKIKTKLRLTAPRYAANADFPIPFRKTK